MKLGIMQPYFFPYLGYFQLMNAVDQWIVFDTPQYIRRGWVNRNRVLSSSKSQWTYVQIPTAKHGRETPIKHISMSQGSDWRRELAGKLDFYRIQRAPYYSETIDFVGKILDFQTSSLCDFLVESLLQTQSYLEIDLSRFEVYSKMNLELPQITHAGQWALEISKASNATTYLNPPGGRDIFDTNEFRDAGIELRFITPELLPYDQKLAEFVGGLSIIDVLMWCGRKATSDLVRLGTTGA